MATGYARRALAPDSQAREPNGGCCHGVLGRFGARPWSSRFENKPGT